MGCSRENCQICADTKHFSSFREMLPTEEMKEEFNGIVDRLLSAEEELSMEEIWSEGYYDFIMWYLALDDAYNIDDLYGELQPEVPIPEYIIQLEGMTFMHDWRTDIRENLYDVMHDHRWDRD